MGEMETWKEMDALSREESIKRLLFLLRDVPLCMQLITVSSD